MPLEIQKFSACHVLSLINVCHLKVILHWFFELIYRTLVAFHEDQVIHL
jgi:hypothetical protein